MLTVKLFVSLRATLCAVMDERVDIQTLMNESLFFFLCHTRARVMDADACILKYASRWQSERQQKMRAAHALLVTALLRAEAENRIVWPPPGGHLTYARLRELLTANGQQFVPRPHGLEESRFADFLQVIAVCPHLEVVH